MIESDLYMKFDADKLFEGGDTFQTNECLTDGGDFLFIYNIARLGNFHYRFNSPPEGYYYVNLHFVEMINTFGPKGMRVFNVFLQDENASSIINTLFFNLNVSNSLENISIKNFYFPFFNKFSQI